MRYERAESFIRDYERLAPDEQKLFKDAVRDFNRACDAWRVDPNRKWPDALRVHRMKGQPGVWEMTWSFAGPDGRATFSWQRDAEGELVLAWRRVGGHDIFTNP